MSGLTRRALGTDERNVSHPSRTRATRPARPRPDGGLEGGGEVWMDGLGACLATASSLFRILLGGSEWWSAYRAWTVDRARAVKGKGCCLLAS
jgi:hypothetical protein